MPDYIPLNPDFKFSYKGWIISIEQIFIFKIYFSIDVFGIHELIKKALKEKGLENNPRAKSLLNAIINEGSGIWGISQTSMTVFHTFNWPEKCKQDAINHINNILGDGITYAKRENIIPSLKYFI
ncbi:hypothetical protein [Limibacterium fermenti]|uniref:hypothetical protein n=1 Tax=Limibacterium fermenti TaxID=3229863 RepID=UPI003A75D331